MRKPNGYWTKEKCKEEIEKYTSRSEFQKKSKGAYKACFKNKWIDELFKAEPKHKPNGYWTEQRCKEEVAKYETITEFIKKSTSVYRKIKSNKWEYLLDNLIQRKPSNFWNFDNCKQEALKYSSRKDFGEKSISAYTTSLKNGWIDDICQHMSKIGNKYLRCIYVFEFPDNYCYVGLTYNIDKRKHQHFNDTKSCVYKHMSETDITPLLKQITDYIDVEEASKLESIKVKEYEKLGWKLLNKAKCGAIGGKKLKWTKEKCMEAASNFKHRVDFKKGNPQAYDAAFNHGYLNEVCTHMKPLTNRDYYKNKL
jgi:predicted GIY-YIG superfamily endonuclease